MEKRRNEKLNAETSLLGFGAMRLAVDSDGAIDYDICREMVDKAIAGGVNYFDTAYVYHAQKSEVFLGDELVARYPRDSIYLATKLPTFNVKKTEDMETMLDESLKRLRTDYIDFYLMHSLNWAAWEKMKSYGVEEFIDKAKRNGKIRRIGFSTHASPEDLKKIINDYPKWEFVQMQVNYADWEMDPWIKACYEVAENAKVPVIIMEPVRGGSLADPEAPAVKKISEALRPGVTPASVAFRWAAERKAAFVILSGMSAVAQVEENIQTFSPIAPLADEERKAIEETIKVMKSFPIVPCTACGYCLDGCPNDIPIDDLFDGFNSFLYYKNVGHFTRFFPREGHRPSDCIECGACAAICPQHIDVPTELKRVDALYKEQTAK